MKEYKYFKIETIHEEVKYYTEEDERTIVELGIGCNGEKHAATLTRLFMIDDEVVHGESIHDFELGKCTCKISDKMHRPDLGWFILGKDIEKQNKQKTFKFHWIGGKAEYGEGNSVADAFGKLGYSAGAIIALDWYEEIVNK